VGVSTNTGTLATLHWSSSPRDWPMAATVRVWDWDHYWSGNPVPGELYRGGWLFLLGGGVLGLFFLFAGRPPIGAHRFLPALAPLLGVAGGFGLAMLILTTRGGEWVRQVPPLMIVLALGLPASGFYLAILLVKRSPARCPRCQGRAYFEGRKPAGYRCADCGYSELLEAAGAKDIVPHPQEHGKRKDRARRRRRGPQ
jgi:hypothetical protein